MRAKKPQQRARTYEDGFSDRDQQTVNKSFEYWRWEEWLTYIGATAFITLLLLVCGSALMWTGGVFIRWEVGPMIREASKQPYTNLNEGWSEFGCARANADESLLYCTFRKKDSYR